MDLQHVLQGLGGLVRFVLLVVQGLPFESCQAEPPNSDTFPLILWFSMFASASQDTVNTFKILSQFSACVGNNSDEAEHYSKSSL